MKNKATTSKKFKTPHEAKATAKAKKDTAKARKAKGSKRDAFGGLVGSRCSKINVAVIEAGTAGGTAKEIASKTGEDAALVSAQLCWMFNPKGFLTREKEGKSYRYFVKAS